MNLETRMDVFRASAVRNLTHRLVDADCPQLQTIGHMIPKAALLELMIHAVAAYEIAMDAVETEATAP